jgi:O-antigen/teichoic acid export membrane protein
MTTSSGSHAQILRSSTLIGGASILNILIGLVRTKVLAMLLGPAGVGLMGLLQSLLAAASSAASLGIGTAGTRQIAEASSRDDPRAISHARQALLWATGVLAILGGLCIWLLRDVLADKVLDSPAHASDVGWLAIGVALTVAAGSQTALLNGLRRVADLAAISVGGAVLSTVLGIAAVLSFGSGGLALFVISAPIASFCLGHWFVHRLRRDGLESAHLWMLRREWSSLAKLGFAFMISGLVGSGGQLAVRSLVQSNLGAVSLGHFQAAWTISMTYVGFVLAAMGTDFYPRLTACIGDATAANRLMNEQTEVALLLAGPIILLTLGLAPFVIQFLYTKEFVEAATILRWQVLGDVLKIASWPLGFAILAKGDGKTFMGVEAFAMAVYTLFTWAALPIWGIQATGIGFAAMYLGLLGLNYWLANRRTEFQWENHVLLLLALVLALGATVSLLGLVSDWLAGSVGVIASLGLGLVAVSRLSALVNPEGWLARTLRPIHSATLAVLHRVTGRARSEDRS